MDISKIELIPPKNLLEPCLILEAEITTRPEEMLLELNGVVIAEDDKLVSHLEPHLDFRNGLMELEKMHASDNSEYRQMMISGKLKIYKLRFRIPLSRFGLDHLENLRSRNPRRDMVLKFRLVAKYLVSNLATSHLHGIDLNRLQDPLRSSLERIQVGTSRGALPPDSLIVYKYDPEFSSPRINMWILSSQGGSTILRLCKLEKEFSYVIPASIWIQDYLPELKHYRFLVLEIPQIEHPIHPSLEDALKELENSREFLIKGDYAAAMVSLRNVLMNHILKKNDQGIRDIRVIPNQLRDLILSKVPQEASSGYQEVMEKLNLYLRALLGHLNKFIHEDTGKMIRAPLRADAEYVFLGVANALRYISELIAG